MPTQTNEQELEVVIQSAFSGFTLGEIKEKNPCETAAEESEQYSNNGYFIGAHSDLNTCYSVGTGKN